MELLRIVTMAAGVVLVIGLAEAQQGVPLIARRVLFGNPEKAQGRISPDGKLMSFLAPVDGVLNVWVGPAGKPKAARPVTRDKKRGIREHLWAHTNQHVIYLQDKDGDENWRVYCVDLGTDEIKDLTPLEGVQARVQEVSHLFPSEILVGLNDRNAQLHDIHRVNIRTGERELVLENPGFAGIMTDDHFVPRLAMALSPEGGLGIVRLKDDGSFEPLATIGPEDIMTTNALGFDQTGDILYLTDSRGRNTAALAKLNLATLEQEIIAEDDRVDIGGVMMHPTEKTLQAYSTTYERQEWHPLDADVAEDLEVLKGVADGEPEIVSRTLDDSVWVVTFTVDDGSGPYYQYNRETKKAKFLFNVQPALDRAPLVKMHSVVIRSRDGLELVSYLSLPPGSDPNGNARPKKPVPLVLWVHGGPWARDTWGLHTVHQWLANRGYAVLGVNFRGSTGFGKAFVNAANREWGRKMHDDLIDAVNWAIEQRIADPQRVAISGGSYGGYATLVGMTLTPQVFACGVDLVGPSNLITLLENAPAYWVPIMPVWKDRVGDHTTEDGQAFLLERSPLTYVDRISKPLLIGQGANDPRVTQQESDQIVTAMQEKGIPVTYALYPDEGHGFGRPENSISFFAVAEAFLAEHLGGRYEPIKDDFEGSSIQVPVGAEELPGLKEALGRQTAEG